MFVFSARTFLFMACVLISLKITFFNPCHPLCGLCCSFLPKQKKIFHFQKKARSKVTSSGNTRNHRNIAHNKLELKRKKNRTKNKTNKSSGTKVQVQPLKARHSERRCVVMVNAFKEKKHLPILCPGGSRALGHSVVNSALIRYWLTSIKKYAGRINL